MQEGTPQQRAPVNDGPGHRSLRNVKQQFYLKTSNVPSLIMGYVTGQAYRFKEARVIRVVRSNDF